MREAVVPRPAKLPYCGRCHCPSSAPSCRRPRWKVSLPDHVQVWAAYAEPWTTAPGRPGLQDKQVVEAFGLDGIWLNFEGGWTQLATYARAAAFCLRVIGACALARAAGARKLPHWSRRTAPHDTASHPRHGDSAYALHSLPRLPTRGRSPRGSSAADHPLHRATALQTPHTLPHPSTALQRTPLLSTAPHRPPQPSTSLHTPPHPSSLVLAERSNERR